MNGDDATNRLDLGAKLSKVWIVLDSWMVGDGMVPQLAVGDDWETGLRIVIDEAEEVDSSRHSRLLLAECADPLATSGPRYDIVGTILPHPWKGEAMVDAGGVVAMAHNRRGFPAGAKIEAHSLLLADPVNWNEELQEAFPDGWRRWRVRQVVIERIDYDRNDDARDAGRGRHLFEPADQIDCSGIPSAFLLDVEGVRTRA